MSVQSMWVVWCLGVRIVGVNVSAVWVVGFVIVVVVRNVDCEDAAKE